MLRTTHHGKWLVVTGFGLWGMYMSLQFFLGAEVPYFGHYGFSATLVGVIYLLSGLGKVIGGNTRMTFLSTYGLTGCIILSMFLGISYALAHNSIVAGCFVLIGLIQVAVIIEPDINPATAGPKAFHELDKKIRKRWDSSG